MKQAPNIARVSHYTIIFSVKYSQSNNSKGKDCPMICFIQDFIK